MVFFNIDAEKGEGAELAEEFKVKGYPTFVVTNADGETINRWAGYDSPDDFIETVTKTLADPTTIDEKIARYETKPTLDDALALSGYYSSSGQFAEAADYIEQALAFEDADPALTYEAFIVYRWGYSDDAFSIDDVRAAADRAVESGALDAEQHLYLAMLMAKAAGDDAEWSAAPYIDSALAATEDLDDPELESNRRYVLIEQALRITGDKDRALELKREGLPEGWESDAKELNAFAWWCFENELNLEEAESSARLGVELAEADEEKAMIIDTLAEVVYLRGEEAEAVELIQQAIELSPDSDYYKEQLGKFSGETDNLM